MKRELIDIFWRQMGARLDIPFRRVFGCELRAYELCGPHAFGCVNVTLQSNDAGCLVAETAQTPIHRVSVFAVEANNMRALMMLEEVLNPGRLFSAIFARQDFEVGAFEHHTAVAGAQRPNRIARFPGGGMRGIRRKLETHSLVAVYGNCNIADRHAYMIDIIDVHFTMIDTTRLRAPRQFSIEMLVRESALNACVIGCGLRHSMSP